VKNVSPSVALVHLASHGDLLYASAIARQIKELDFPNCHLTWYVSTSCASTLANNPYVDALVEIESGKHDAYRTPWQVAKETATSGNHDHIFHTQILPDNLCRFDGAIRTSIFNNYPHRIRVPVAPLLRLSDSEVARVSELVARTGIESFRNRILFECAPGSGQSFLDLPLAIEISMLLTNADRNTCVVISSPHSLPQATNQIIDGSQLTFRENAELANYCNLLIGCSSGITWLLTSDWCRQIPTVQLLSRADEAIFASVVYDLEYFGQDVSHVVEMTQGVPKDIVACVDMVLKGRLDAARQKFGERLRPSIDNKFLRSILDDLTYSDRLMELLTFIRLYMRRNGFSLRFLLRVLFLLLQRLTRKIVRMSSHKECPPRGK
jgi:hypothetical protein